MESSRNYSENNLNFNSDINYSERSPIVISSYRNTLSVRANTKDLKDKEIKNQDNKQNKFKTKSSADPIIDINIQFKIKALNISRVSSNVSLTLILTKASNMIIYLSRRINLDKLIINTNKKGRKILQN